MGDLSVHFSRSEFACKCSCGMDTVDTELLTILEVIRDHFDAVVKINSGCRCLAHNKAVGGGTNSFHLLCRASDIEVEGVPASEVQDYCNQIWPDKYGIGAYNTFTHLDSRGYKARWGSNEASP